MGFNGITTGVTDSEYGKPGTIILAKLTDSGIKEPYTIYNNYQARYCYDKNRGTGTNGEIKDEDVKWYLPAINQLKSVWEANIADFVNSDKVNDYYYGSATEYPRNEADPNLGTTKGFAFLFNFKGGFATYGPKSHVIPVRCVRDLIPHADNDSAIYPFRWHSRPKGY